MKQKKYVERSVEFRSTSPDDSDGRNLTGYGAVFNQDIEISSWEGSFTERIQKGAFRKTLSERTPVVQFDHGRDSRVGSVPIAKIEELKEDSQGLFIRARLFDNPLVEPVRQAIEAQAISGMSFKFRVLGEVWRDPKGRRVSGAELERLLSTGTLTRTITEVQLAELGPVVFPAYAGTSVGVRDSAATPYKLLAAERRLNILGL
ncbi:HK97 family phage prohead protease [Rhodococcoides fascians]|uniref:HK97 family phage prohead protease n=1 Tax=Rhodococcoides fascians TaxID=1828 RepID=UPI000689527D|nr:HK97 family phage prohead protease [Rhodococcus fascians]